MLSKNWLSTFTLLTLSLLFFSKSYAKERGIKIKTDTTYASLDFEKGRTVVNHCTPWDHLQCIFITGTEVYKDGRDGKSSRHWWRMSYIGRACTDRYGKTFGKIFEGIFVIPHYAGVALGNGIGLLVYTIRGPEEKRKSENK